MNAQSESGDDDPSKPAVAHERFVEVMNEPGEGVRLDTSKCLGMLNDGGLGRIPFIVSNFVGLGFHLVCWAALVYLFVWNWVYGLLGIPAYLVLVFLKTVVLEHWFAVNLTLARAKNDPAFYRTLCARDVLEVESSANG